MSGEAASGARRGDAPGAQAGGASNAQLVERLAAVECPAFRHRREQRAGAAHGAAPIVLARGDGSALFDVEGTRYVDLVAGFGAVLLGHGHPALGRAIAAQSARLVQGLGDVYASEVKLALLERLAALLSGALQGAREDALGESALGEGPGTEGLRDEAPLGARDEPSTAAGLAVQGLLCQSGADAVTAALKTAMLATGRPGVLAFEGAYHGLGYAPLPACGFAPGFAAPFAAQLNPHVRFAPYPGVCGATAEQSLEQAEAALRRGEIGALLIEPVVGRGGCVAPPDGFLAQLGELARQHGALLIADEIWTGLGRAGALFSSVAQGARPDIVCLGKGLGGGLPISVCLARAEVMAAWARGGEVVHTSTHAGAPLGCAAALAVLQVLEQERLIERARRLGAALMAACRGALSGCPQLREVRGRGLMVGIALDSAASAQRAMAGLLARGFIAISGGVDGATLTLTPALTIAEQELVAVAPVLRESLA